MSYLRPRLFALSLLVVALAWAMAVPAFADPMDQVTEVGTLSLATDLTSQATLTYDPDAGTFSLSFKITNNSTTTASINALALQLFTGSSADATVTSATLPSGWQYFSNQKINNNGTTGCTGINHPGWLCADDNGTNPASPADIMANGGTLDFLFSGTFGGNGAFPLDLMANGLTNTDNSHSKWAVSAGMDMQTPPPVPEPASLFLLGSGLLGVGTLLRRKRG